ncbi:uncharacterized protein SPPG_08532 [Spizellomyces punctatus DAOM BR117]|uniref:RWD domain-containing protein n=1 Tax=Spizellomyces punctatus (strain DAOM BR117) TaxID=645134 RepID=A0A0L0H5A6_SPIPD|nr:uncharacterized protein SPPG_08532 [Spizellomyces punctatus DAOM BR117]KNC96144.1 hypothetical protein SPPG_08532 [Spizellomyces punctatus DAOM BR117]|eukprot:XP_016604184.1 hypothetical protein SPPG_08532 [Spizellomyces punctatus DAOM BR117]
MSRLPATWEARSTASGVGGWNDVASAAEAPTQAQAFHTPSQLPIIPKRKKKKNFDPSWLKAPPHLMPGYEEKLECRGCARMLSKGSFSKVQLREDDRRRCRECIDEYEGSWADVQRPSKTAEISNGPTPVKAATKPIYSDIARSQASRPQEATGNGRRLVQTAHLSHGATPVKAAPKPRFGEGPRRQETRPLQKTTANGQRSRETVHLSHGATPVKAAVKPKFNEGTGRQDTRPQKTTESVQRPLEATHLSHGTTPVKAAETFERQRRPQNRLDKPSQTAVVKGYEGTANQPGITRDLDLDAVYYSRKRQLSEIALLKDIFLEGEFGWMACDDISKDIMTVYDGAHDDPTVLSLIPSDHEFRFAIQLTGPTAKSLEPCQIRFTLPPNYPYCRPVCRFTCSTDFPHVANTVASALKTYMLSLKIEDGRVAPCLLDIHQFVFSQVDTFSGALL